MEEPVTDGDDYNLHRQLAIVDVVTPLSHFISNSNSNFNSSSITPFSSPFSLPHGWIIQQVPSSDGHRVDTYYTEPETGRKFRSINEVQRYLSDEESKATRFRPLRLDYRIKNLSNRSMIISGENMTPESKWITTKFTVPENWFVEKVPRKSGSTIDKYYHDPETGRKFRSLKDVERYLTEGFIPARSKAKRLKYHEKHLQKCSNRKKMASGGKMLDFEEDNKNQFQLINITLTSFPSTSSFQLPDGWIVEEVTRKTGDHIDRYYYEPGTGRKFRSLTAVQKHLSELEENAPLSLVLEELRENNVPISKAFKLATPIKNYGSYDSRKKSTSKKEDSSFNNPPNKINWVINNTGIENWNAFVGDKLIPDSMKQQWGKRFMLAINNTKHNA